MSKFYKRASLLMVVLLISALVVGCGGGNKSSNNSGSVNDSSTTVSLALAQSNVFSDDLANSDNWEFVNGSTVTVSNGIMKVTEPKNKTNSEGIAMKLKDPIWQNIVAKLGGSDSFYVEMLIKPTSLSNGSSNKNFGIASHISIDNNQWYYAGINANGRMQAGSSTNLKGWQNTGDGVTFNTESDLIYYKFRYEYNKGVINFYYNDLYMGKNSTLANYAANPAGYTGSVGIYTSGSSFEVDSVRVGALTENQTKLILSTTDASLPRLWSNYIKLINNTSSSGIRVDDEVQFNVTAKNASGAPDTWTATSTNPNVLAATASGVDGGTLTLKGMGIGKATVVISNGADKGSKRAITYSVAEKLNYIDDTYTGIITKVYPNIGALAAYADGELAITFDSAPSIVNSTGVMFIKKYSDDSVVDTIKLVNATESAFNTDRGVSSDLVIGDQMVRIEGNTLYITPHFGKLAYETKYYIAIPNGIISGVLGGKPFTGFSPSQKNWNFTTKAKPTTSGPTITVNGSQSSTADFRTVQMALKYVADNSINNAIIQIAPGTYRELLTFKKDQNITLMGTETGTYGDRIVIQYTNGNSWNGSTNGRPVVYIASTGTVNLVNLTLRNTGEKSVVNQAETIYFASDAGKLVAKNCSFKSQQDTILTKGYNWFYKCYIEGNTDFIWGYAKTALFEDCSLKVLTNGSNYSVIFQARSPKLEGKGYVLLNCSIANENIAGGGYFARSGGDTSVADNVSIINCKLTGSSIVKNWYTKDVDPGTPNPTPATASATAGWKQYGLTDGSGNAVAVSNQNAYTLTTSEYNAGWANRTLIFGGSNWTPVEP
ncbi:MAG TPA: pectinesterase family protein [Bacillota bacterium]|nr:pectinesterase family protein [Bacillota bacterium]